MGVTSLTLGAFTVALCLWPLSLPSIPRDAILLAEACTLMALAVLSFGHAWAVLLFVQPFLPLYPSFLGQTKITVVRAVLLSLAAALAMTRFSRFVRIAGKSSFVFWAALAFAGANVVSAFAVRSIDSVARSFTYFEPALFFAVSYCVVFLRPRRLDMLVRAVLLSGFFVALLAMVEMVTQQPLTSLFGVADTARLTWIQENRFGFGGRVTSTIGQPVYTGIFVCLWVAVWVSYFRKRSRLTATLVFGWGSLILAATAARGPILVAALLLLLGAFWRGRLAVRTGIIVLGIAAVWWLQLAGLPPVAQHFKAALSLEPTREEAANLIGRADLTWRMVSIFRENPWVGIGPGRIQHAALAGDPQFTGLGGLENTYAVVAADTGAAGLMTYVVFVIATIAAAAAAFRRAPSRAARGLAGGLLWFFVFQSIVAVSVFCPTGITANLSLALLGGLLAAIRQTDGEVETAKHPVGVGPL